MAALAVPAGASGATAPGRTRAAALAGVVLALCLGCGSWFLGA